MDAVRAVLRRFCAARTIAAAARSNRFWASERRKEISAATRLWASAKTPLVEHPPKLRATLRNGFGSIAVRGSGALARLRPFGYRGVEPPRACLGIEIDPIYVDVAVRRWQAFTGRQATLQATRRTFEAMAAERGPKAGQADAGPAASPRLPAAEPTCSSRKASKPRLPDKATTQASAAPSQWLARPNAAKGIP